MTNIERSVDYQRGFEHGWKECMNQMLKPLVEMERNSGPKPIVIEWTGKPPDIQKIN